MSTTVPGEGAGAERGGPGADRGGPRPLARARVRPGARVALCALLLLAAVASVVPAGASAEQASEPLAPAAGQIDTGGGHTCALFSGSVRCWGRGIAGQLGYGNTRTIGDNEIPGAVGPVDLGAGGPATAISAGSDHTCALLSNARVRCWGFGGDGRLGYRDTSNIGDDEAPAAAGPVELGGPATAISAGTAHTCALLANGDVVCWGFGADGRLGYRNTSNIGDNEAPALAGPVPLGAPATAITAGAGHTCALLNNGRVRCWGFAAEGRLGYGDEKNIGDDEIPTAVGPVDLGDVGGPVRTATAISAGSDHTCALLDNARVRCWGYAGDGQLGYGNRTNIGDTETPAQAGPVELGGNAKAITAGTGHSCARLENASVRCWGAGSLGQLGYGNAITIGDNETPATAGPVDLGGGHTAAAISAGNFFTCAQLDDASVRCWGFNGQGQLGYGNTTFIGDDETPGSAGPVNIAPPPPPTVSINDRRIVEGEAGQANLTFTVTLSSASSEMVGVDFTTADDSAVAPADYLAGSGRVTFPVDDTSEIVNVTVKGDTLDEPDERFLVNLSNLTGATGGDLQGVGTITDNDAPAVNRPPPPKPDPVRPRDDSLRVRAALRGERLRARALRRCLKRAAGSRSRRRCVRRYGRTPGRVTGLKARVRSRTKVVLSFLAPGSDGRRLPAARSYLIKQSTKPMGGGRGFRRAAALCRGSCRFKVTRVGAKVRLTVTDLRPRTTYYYAISARDNVSRRPGPRSRVVRVRTR